MELAQNLHRHYRLLLLLRCRSPREEAALPVVGQEEEQQLKNLQRKTVLLDDGALHRHPPLQEPWHRVLVPAQVHNYAGMILMQFEAIRRRKPQRTIGVDAFVLSASYARHGGILLQTCLLTHGASSSACFQEKSRRVAIAAAKGGVPLRMNATTNCYFVVSSAAVAMIVSCADARRSFQGMSSARVSSPSSDAGVLPTTPTVICFGLVAAHRGHALEAPLADLVVFDHLELEAIPTDAIVKRKRMEQRLGMLFDVPAMTQIDSIRLLYG